MRKLALFSRTVEPQLMEHFDAYVLVGYTADNHRRVLQSNFGKDPSCRDGLRIMEAAAERWLDGSMFPGKTTRTARDGDRDDGLSGSEVSA